MLSAWKRILSFWQRPLNSKWIKQEINASASAQLNELRRIEAQIIEQHASLRKIIEERSQLAAEEAKAYSNHGLGALSKSLEADSAALRIALEVRTQLAADEAKAYADQGLNALSKSLAAANRVVVRISNQINSLDNLLNDNSNTLKTALEDNTRRLAAAEVMTQSISEARALDIVRFEALERDLASAIEQHGSDRDQIKHDITQLISDTTTAHAAFMARFESIDLEIKRIIDDYNAQLRNAEHRIEFTRSEAMYEMQVSGYRSRGRLPPSRTVPRLVDLEKIDAMRANGLRLNIGCGHIQFKDYLNIDSRSLPGIDIIADATDLPFEENELAEIYSSHLVEHFPSHILERVILPHWSALLQPGGVLTTIAPDGEAMLQAMKTDQMEFEDFREVLFGSQDYDGDFHYNLITPETFSKSLKCAGFKNITEEYVGKRNGKCFEFKITAEKG